MDQYRHHNSPHGLQESPYDTKGGYRGRGDFQRGGFRGRGRGFVDMNKPWISPAIKNELWKQINLGKAAKRSKKSEDVNAFSKQKSKVSLLLEDAKLTWLAENPDQEQHWLTVLANEEREKCYWCDVCEKGFGDQSELEEHEQAHQTCGIDGCTYFAHAEVLDKHIMHQHLTGLYNRIAQGTSPEEINKWREERRKNFPTKAKVAEKVAKEKEMRERGEVMGLKREKRKREEIIVEGDDAGARDSEESQCNCRARQIMGKFRGRGRGRGGRLPRNVRHQGHCQELLNIRSRAQETRERKQKSYEERMAKRKKRGEGEKEKVEEETSEEEEPGWNGSIWKFKGTKGVKVEDGVISSVNKENIEETNSISDDEFEKLKEMNPMHKATTVLKTSAGGYISASDRSAASSEEDMDVLETMEQVRKKKKFDVNADVQLDQHQDHQKEHPKMLNTCQLKSKNERETKMKLNDEPTEEIPFTQSVSNVYHDDTNMNSEDEPPEEITIVKGTMKDNQSAKPVDSDDEPPEEMAITKVPLNSYENVQVNPETNYAACKTEIKHVNPSVSASKDHIKGTNVKLPKVGADNKSKKATGRNPVSRKSTSTLDRRMRPQTLLERLLRDEIISERNKILQCVRFVCRNNFFGVGQALPEQGPALPDQGPALPEQGPAPPENGPH